MTVVAPVAAPAPVEAPTSRPRATRRAVMRRPLVMCLVLFAVYCGLALANDPHGVFVSDVGGKVATVRAMDARGDLDVDIGYWAEAFDPDGTLHPLGNTVRIGDRWVNVTTLPMLYASVPLHGIGGVRAMLLLPMLGAVMVALGARALARRLGESTDGDRAFWLIGLATPVVLYGLDFWEHAPGLACMLWAVVLLSDVAVGLRGPRAALAGGLLLGLAATMRTEALVYAVVACAVLGVAAWVRRSRPPVGAGAAVVGGLLLVLGANQLLERWAFGSGLRVSRASDTAGAAGSELATRGKDALITSLGINWFGLPADWVVGGLIVVALAGSAWAFTRADGRHRRVGWVLVALAAYGYLLWISKGVGFVPGALTASPLAVVGLVTVWKPGRSRWLGLVAVTTVPVVWLVQYSGGTEAMWGGRYLLCSATILAVAGVVALRAMSVRAATAFAVLALLVTGAGMVWMSMRTHAFADALADATRSDAPLVAFRAPQLLREAGAFYEPGDRWLSAEDAGELVRAAEIVAATDAAHLDVVSVAGRRVPSRLGEFTRADRRTLDLVRSLRLDVVRYDRE